MIMPIRLSFIVVLSLMTTLGASAQDSFFKSIGTQIVEYRWDAEQGKMVEGWRSLPISSDSVRATTIMGRPWVADVDGDGVNELLAADQLGVLLWRESRSIPTFLPFGDSSSEWSFKHVVVWDIDRDGDNEVLTFRATPDHESNAYVMEAWRLVSADSWVKVSEVEIRDGGGWALEPFFLGDEPAVAVAADEISIVTWRDGGLYEAYRIPSISNMTDYVRIADVDHDGEDELIAVGNGSRVTVHKMIDRFSDGHWEFPVLFQSKPYDGFTQGLLTEDIDGDERNEIIVGVTVSHIRADGSLGFGRSDNPPSKNILIFESPLTPTSWAEVSRTHFEETFSMRLHSANIPAFYPGDYDLDGHLEIIFSGNVGRQTYLSLLEFSRKADGGFDVRVDSAFAETTETGGAVGRFKGPSTDTAPSSSNGIPRLVIGRPHVDAEGSGFFAKLSSDASVPMHFSVFASHQSAEGVEVDILIEGDGAGLVSVSPSTISIGHIAAGETWTNAEVPVSIQTPETDEDLSFDLVFAVRSASGFELRQPIQLMMNKEGAAFQGVVEGSE